MERKQAKSYRDLEIWNMAHELAVEIHKITLTKLPKFELYEESSQIRRSSKSISSNIVEGYGRRRYKNEFIKFLTYAHASCDETIDHLEFLHQTGSLADKTIFEGLLKRYNLLGGKINNFISAVIAKHLTPKDRTKNQADTE
jgi:four helix bundle protein